MLRSECFFICQLRCATICAFVICDNLACICSLPVLPPLATVVIGELCIGKAGQGSEQGSAARAASSPFAGLDSQRAQVLV